MLVTMSMQSLTLTAPRTPTDIPEKLLRHSFVHMERAIVQILHNVPGLRMQRFMFLYNVGVYIGPR